MNTTISSPVAVLMSWCKLTTLTPVTSAIMASITGRAVSIKWVRTCLSRSLPFSEGSFDQLLFGGRQHAVQTDYEQIAPQVSTDALRSAPHVILLEAIDPFTDDRLDFSLRFHDNVGLARTHVCCPGGMGLDTIW